MSNLIEKAQSKKINPSELPSRWATPYAEAVTLLLEEESKHPPVIHNTGIRKLDQMTGGFRPGELIILSGPTKNGKTTFSQTLTWNMAQKGINSLWFTMEMSWQELTKKFMDMDEKYRTDKTATEAPVYYPMQNINAGFGLTMEWLEEVVVEAKKRNGAKLVFIDHLHMLLPLGDYRQNVSHLIGSIVMEVKKIAVRHEVTIIMMAHTKKLASDDVKPNINDIRDSSFIAQNSDYTIMIWRLKDKTTKQNTNNGRIEVAANRRSGKTGCVDIYWDGRTFRDL